MLFLIALVTFDSATAPKAIRPYSVTQADVVLRTKLDKNGRFHLTEKQIEFLKEEFYVYKIHRTEALIHPDGVRRRTIELWSDNAVKNENFTKDEFSREVLRLYPAGYPHKVGFCWLGRGNRWIEKSYDTWEMVPEGRPDGWNQFPGIGTVNYIKFAYSDGRIWIREFSWGDTENE